MVSRGRRIQFWYVARPVSRDRAGASSDRWILRRIRVGKSALRQHHRLAGDRHRSVRKCGCDRPQCGNDRRRRAIRWAGDAVSRGWCGRLFGCLLMSRCGKVLGPHWSGIERTSEQQDHKEGCTDVAGTGNCRRHLNRDVRETVRRFQLHGGRLGKPRWFPIPQRMSFVPVPVRGRSCDAMSRTASVRVATERKLIADKRRQCSTQSRICRLSEKPFEKGIRNG